VMSKGKIVEQGTPAMNADAEQLQHIQGQIQAARQLGYAALDVQLRRCERKAWVTLSLSSGAIGSESETVEAQEAAAAAFHSWEAVVRKESINVAAMLVWVAEAWERRVLPIANKSHSRGMSPSSPQEQRPQSEMEAQAAQLADLQGAIEAHFALLDHLKGLLSSTATIAVPSAADGLSESASAAADFKQSVDRVRDLAELMLMLGEILPLSAIDGHSRVTSNGGLHGTATATGRGRGRGAVGSQPGEEQLLAQCEAAAASASASASASVSASPPMSQSQSSAPPAATDPAHSHRAARVLQALHYYHYKAHEYEACLWELLPDPTAGGRGRGSGWEREREREDSLQKALLHLECISIATHRGGDDGIVESGLRGRGAYLASLSEERKSEAVVVLLALAESLCGPSPGAGRSLDKIVGGREQRQAFEAERARRGTEHSSLARRLLLDLWGARTAPAEVRRLISHADEVGRACSVKPVGRREG
jgi:hypothetical protein